MADFKARGKITLGRPNLYSERKQTRAAQLSTRRSEFG